MVLRLCGGLVVSAAGFAAAGKEGNAMGQTHRREVFVDWACEAEDALYSLREEYEDLYPDLRQERLDTLCENYRGEDTKDSLKALGQELSAMQYALYSLKTDGDSYGLVLVKEQETGEFEEELSAGKRSGKRLLQRGKKPGAAAKRIDPGKRLAGQEWRLDPGWRFSYGMDMELGSVWAEAADHGAAPFAGVDISAWPPKICALPQAVSGLDAEGGALGILYEKRGEGTKTEDYAAVGNALDRPEEWKSVCVSRLGMEYTTLKWYHGDLFLAGRAYAAVIRNAVNGISEPEIIFRSGKRDLTFPFFFIRNDRLYLCIQHEIYRWQEKGFLKKEGFQKKIYTVSGNGSVEHALIGEEEIALIGRVTPVPRAGAPSTDMAVLNVETGKVWTIPCLVGNLGVWDERVCVMPYVDSAALKAPILQCFDLKTKECRSLPYGAVGKACLTGLVQRPDGRALLRTSDDRLILPDDLWEAMQKQ